MRRSAFTLFEMVVVMFLVVVAASLAIPVIDSMVNPSQVTGATDAVRSSWEAARNRAMEEGRPYRFSIKDGGGSFRIEADDADANTDQSYTFEGVLPDTCLFVTGGAGVIDPMAKPSETGTWKTIAVFLPDGTAREDAELSFGRPGLLRVTLKLRALTGSVSKAPQEAAK